jgi:hypothetical protein
MLDKLIETINNLDVILFGSSPFRVGKIMKDKQIIHYAEKK